MRGRIVGAALALFSIGLAAASCSTPQSLGRGFDVDAGAPAPSFTDTDAFVEEAEAGNGLTNYCPSNRCPAGFTTCPSSAFLCDVNLLADRNNCGECGRRCPVINGTEFECVEGSCQMKCGLNPRRADCDGVVDNGCETMLHSDQNCGGCGIACTDPDKPCVEKPSGPSCGCSLGQLYCYDAFFGKKSCVDPKSNDKNCGACGTICNPDGPTGERPTNAYYGCVEGKCDQPKCEQAFLDCDQDLSNGCETFAFSNEHCGACGKACPAGMECKGNRYGIPTCSCAANQTYCPIYCVGDWCIAGHCADLASDREHCGACGNRCRLSNDRSSTSICISGLCSFQCVKGRADCNGDPADECEVNTDNDPQNCGACGKVCDAVAGQACVGGQCVVEPCEQVEPDGGKVQ